MGYYSKKYGILQNLDSEENFDNLDGEKGHKDNQKTNETGGNFTVTGFSLTGITGGSHQSNPTRDKGN